MIRLFHKDSDCGHHHEPGETCTHHHDTEEKKETQKTELPFSEFLNFFPKVELPLILNTDMQRQISEMQDPINAAWMEKFVLDTDQIDEFTEFMPCFQIADSNSFSAIIYWQASLEGNAFFLTTFSKAGNIIDQKLLAGTLYLEDGMKQLVCSIGQDWTINRSEGMLGLKGEIIKSEQPKITFMQITLEGEILED